MHTIAYTAIRLPPKNANELMYLIAYKTIQAPYKTQTINLPNNVQNTLCTL